MPEYIERGAAIRALTLNDCDSARAKMAIFDIPPADVALVRHGRWVTDKRHNGEPYCSECDYEAFCGDKTNFCPNCGAKMALEMEYPHEKS